MSILDLLPDNLTHEEALELLEELSAQDCLTSLYDWDGIHARENQKPPAGDWLIWLKLAGRGEGKTRVGSEWIIDGARRGMKRQALVGATYGDVRDVMIEGESGILECSPPGFRPRYLKSERKLVWPNGCIAIAYAGEEPERLRGPQNHRAWVDELAAWRNVKKRKAAIDNLLLGLRLGDKPQVYISTTPKPVEILRELVKDPQCVVVGGSTYDNLDNLAEAYERTVIAKYEGTTLGAQELDGMLLDEVPGALWKRAWFDRDRVQEMPRCDLLAVALDPNVTDTSDTDEAGIIWGGRARKGSDRHYFIGGDLTTDNGPDVWAPTTVNCYDTNALDWIVYEANQGGDLVKKTMKVEWEKTRKSELPIKKVNASRGKRARAEPIALLYQQGKVHHVGMHVHLEDQLVSWVPGEGDSPGRLDADVWLVTFLSTGAAPGAGPADMSSTSRF